MRHGRVKVSEHRARQVLLSQLEHCLDMAVAWRTICKDIPSSEAQDAMLWWISRPDVENRVAYEESTSGAALLLRGLDSPGADQVLQGVAQAYVALARRTSE